MHALNFTEFNSGTEDSLHIFIGRVLPYLVHVVQGLLFGGIPPYLIHVTDEGSYECPQGKVALTFFNVVSLLYLMFVL